jgi:glutamine synthetase
MSPESPFDGALDGVWHVYLEFPDINGISRSKQVTADHFCETWREGFPVNMLVLVQTPRNHVPTGTGFGEEIEYGDGSLHPEPSTRKPVPWRDDAVRVLCDVEYEGEVVGVNPRTALQSVLDDVDLDVEFFVGSELEFSLLDGAEEGDGYEPVTDHKHEWISWATDSVGSFHDRLLEWGRAYDVPIQSLEHEHGPGQFEVLFDYGSPLSQADTTFDFKRLVKAIAKRAGQEATFMAKPFAGESGNGYHLHVSAFDGNENAFDAADGLSETGRAFVAGVLEHVDALTAFHAPTLNAYKRFDPHGFAPDTASWGFDNRMTSVRIPTGTTRVENRIGSADANPYLIVAGTLAAGVDGVRRSLDPGDAVTGNPAGRYPQLPRSPHAALGALEDDEVLVDALGEDLVRAFVASKRRSLAEFRDTVTDWERDQYVELL